MSFEEIYDTYYSKIFRLCMGYMNDHDWAQDVTQETFITVWQKLSQFRNESAIGTWIYRIASNHCLRQLEKQSKMPKAEMPVQIEDKQPPDTDTQVQLLYKCIAELPEIDRIIISLELEDVKQAEIANIVGLSETNIRVKVYRIKERLSQKFKKYEHQY
ncbi:RNA polymerase sigma factor [Mucilaginibacter sp. HC2]|uniref:RNA polymerase sigma factor n=1 Tax=Mucilaginibacter inviolabilis TaxID=2714892 RepID=UPI00140B2932|nr:RNA polymerase sigma factor [Mucilaginibacter inviolabilis]NHA05436.1 RNA polymerase sigma factor [Mucilaginibacter inviolabilis]